MHKKKVLTVIVISVILLISGLTTFLLIASHQQTTSERQSTLKPHLGEHSTENEIRTLQENEFQPSITITSPRNNERLEFQKLTVQVVITQPEEVSFEISTVEFRYTYSDQYLKWSDWQEMTLKEEGIYEAFLIIDRELFNENEAYSIESRFIAGTISKTTGVNFYPDSRPESGVDLGKLNPPVEILAAEEENFVKFVTVLSFTESHYIYDLPIPQTWISTLEDMSLITQYGSDDPNLIDINLYQESDEWRLILEFSQKPEVSTESNLFIYEEGVTVTNPVVESIGTNDIYLSFDITTHRNWENVHIPETEFPSDFLEQAWWAHELSEYQTWRVYDQDDNELTVATIVVKTAATNEYAPLIEVTGLTIPEGTIKLFLKGTTEASAITEPGGETAETEREFPLNIPALFLIALLPFAGYTLTVFRPAWFEDGRKKKIMLIGLAAAGVILAVVIHLLEFDVIHYVLLNLPALLLFSIVGLGSYTGLLMLEISGFDLSFVKKIASLAGFVVAGLVFSRFVVPFIMTTGIGSLMAIRFPEIKLPKLTIPEISLPAISLPTDVLILFTPTIFVVVLILSSRMLQRGFSEKQIFQMVLADIIAEIMLLILYVRGTLQLAITEMETSELMLINISMGLMIAFAIIVGTAFIIKINKGEVPIR